MQVQIHSIHFDADARLLEFVQTKLDKLLTYNGDIQSCEVFLRVEKNDFWENKVVEVKGYLLGYELFAK
jgi:putative sigma-54 modulation protein